MKKSFVIYTDSYDTLKYLSDEKLGKVTRMIYEFVIDGNFPDPTHELFFVFNPIKLQLERDLDRYETVREKRSKAGKASAQQKQHMLTHVESVQQKQNMLTVNDNVSVSVSVSDSVSDSINKKKIYRDIKSVRSYIESENLIKDSEILNYYIDFIEMKLSLKKPVTEKSIHLSIKKLIELSGGKKNIAIKIIENSIEANWQTFYPLKDNTPKNEKPTFTRASQGVHLS